MPKLTSRPTNRVLKALNRDGWLLRASKPGKGHYILINTAKPGILTVPRHPMIKKGTLGKIIKQAGLTLETFDKLYR